MFFFKGQTKFLVFFLNQNEQFIFVQKYIQQPYVKDFVRKNTACQNEWNITYSLSPNLTSTPASADQRLALASGTEQSGWVWIWSTEHGLKDQLINVWYWLLVLNTVNSRVGFGSGVQNMNERVS